MQSAATGQSIFSPGSCPDQLSDLFMFLKILMPLLLLAYNRCPPPKLQLPASGGIGILFVGAVPAIYRLNLLSVFPKDDVGKLIALTATAGFFGVFFVIPLRRYYIVHQKLTFPTPAATAYTIRALHNGRTGAIAARKKSLALLYSFIVTFVYKVISGYAPGIVSSIDGVLRSLCLIDFCRLCIDL